MHLQTSNEALSLPIWGRLSEIVVILRESPYHYDNRVGVKVKELLSFQGKHSQTCEDQKNVESLSFWGKIPINFVILDHLELRITWNCYIFRARSPQNVTIFDHEAREMVDRHRFRVESPPVWPTFKGHRTLQHVNSWRSVPLVHVI